MAQVAVGRVPRGPGIRMGNRQPDQKLIGKKCVFFFWKLIALDMGFLISHKRGTWCQYFLPVCVAVLFLFRKKL